MLSALDELFGRNFAVGFLLPATAAVVGVLWLCDVYALFGFDDLWALADQNQLMATLMLPMVLWIAGITLMALNFWIIRLAEGYMVPMSWLFFAGAGIWALDRCGVAVVRPVADGLGVEPVWVAMGLPVLAWLVGFTIVRLVYRVPALSRRWEPPLNPFLRRQRRLYDDLHDSLDAVREELDRCADAEEEPPEALLDAERELDRDRASRFPHRLGYVQPSLFGNLVRAVESYPVELYGFEVTRGWSRLLAVVPREYRELIDSAKAEMDFLVNIWSVSWALLLGYLFLFELTGVRVGLWVPLVAYGSVRLSSWFSCKAVGRWGETTVKAAADVFLPDLWEKLELPRRASSAKRFETWRALSDAWLFRDPDRLPRSRGGFGTARGRAGTRRRFPSEERPEHLQQDQDQDPRLQDLGPPGGALAAHHGVDVGEHP